MSTTRVMINLQGVSKVFSNPVRIEVLKNIHASFEDGKWISLMGPSGSGKSTLLSILAGLDVPSSGKVLYSGQDLAQMDEDQRASFRAANMGFIFQSFRLIPTLTVLENVLLPLQILGKSGQESLVRDLVSRVGLKDRGGHFPGQLSGGEQQRVAIARAFVTKPKVLLADEPTGNLDYENSENVLSLLTELHKENSSTLIVVSHDPQVAARADIRLSLNKGELVAHVS